MIREAAWPRADEPNDDEPNRLLTLALGGAVDAVSANKFVPLDDSSVTAPKVTVLVDFAGIIEPNSKAAFGAVFDEAPKAPKVVLVLAESAIEGPPNVDVVVPAAEDVFTLVFGPNEKSELTVGLVTSLLVADAPKLKAGAALEVLDGSSFLAELAAGPKEKPAGFEEFVV